MDLDRIRQLVRPGSSKKWMDWEGCRTAPMAERRSRRHARRAAGRLTWRSSATILLRHEVGRGVLSALGVDPSG